MSKEVDVDELFMNLKLHGEDLNDDVLGAKEVRCWPAVKWLVAAKVLTRKSIRLHFLKWLAGSSVTKETIVQKKQPEEKTSREGVESNDKILAASVSEVRPAQ